MKPIDLIVDDVDRNDLSLTSFDPIAAGMSTHGKDSLSEILRLPEDSLSNEIMANDTNSLIVDLNDLLKRDPTLASLSDENFAVEATSFPTFEEPPTARAIPVAAKPFSNVTQVPNNSPATWTSVLSSKLTAASCAPVKMEVGHLPAAPDGLLGGGEIKMETGDFSDIDDLDALFMKNSSPNVSFGVGPQGAAAAASGGFAGAGSAGSSIPWSTNLSSSVPSSSYNAASPLSDILADFSSPVASHGVHNNNNGSSSQSVSPNVSSLSPSQAGPARHSTLHKLLMKKDNNAVLVRPVVGVGAEGRPASKTLGVMRQSLSASNPLLSQQLSASAPASNHGLIWARREPRQHISSVCSVGDNSALVDDVNDVLSRIDPNDLQDIASDDEDNADKFKDNTTEDDSDVEGVASPSTPKAGSSGKKERHFWQYNVQAKGPKGQKINFETRIADPHVLNDIVDPVFSGDVQLQGIKHSGKARRGDGNDLTANPKKLAAIGRELDMLSREINDLTPVSEMPYTRRCDSRKEKNKLASRACRLKKKAQHEANKLKCEGLKIEHSKLIQTIDQAKAILMAKVDPSCTRPQHEMTQEMDQLVKDAMSFVVSGDTSGFVNRMIEENMPYV